MNLIKLLFAVICCFLATQLMAQVDAAGSGEKYRITGKVVNVKGESMPFVNVYVEKTTKGTTTNENGRFSMSFNRAQRVSLVFQFVGFEKQVVVVEPEGAVTNIEVTMRDQNVELPQFVVSAKGRDPAYAIIKQAQQKRKDYLNQVEAYSAEVYMKGATRLNEIPDKKPLLLPAEAMPDSTDLGLIFLSEAVARYHYEHPYNYKEEMIASKVSGFSQAFSWNRAEDVLINFYENNVKIGGISDRGFISPIGSMAMLHYRYELLGSFKDNGHTIYKIAVEPRRTIDPAFTGNIYIADSLFNIHSLDLTLLKSAGIEFVDTVHVNQTFVPVVPEKAIWMPLSMKMHFHFSVFGFRASHDAVAEFSQYKIDKTFERGFFGNETFRVDAGANEMDSMYWNQARQVVLTDEEVENYYKGDSLEQVRKSKPYLDSIDSRFNKPTVTKLLLTGYEIYRRYDSLRYGINPLISFVQYNVVEGLVIDAAPYFRKIRRHSNYGFAANLRYGTASEQFYGQLKYHHTLNYRNYRRITASGGHYVAQFNSSEPISPILNTSYSLFDKLNYMRLYEKTFGGASFQQEILNGVFFKVGAEYAQRTPLFNKTDYSWSGKDDRMFMPNNPPGVPISSSRALVAEVNMRFKINQKYETYPNRKRMIGSAWPTLFLTYRKGINALESDVNFDFLSVGISYDLNLGQLGELLLDADAGTFLNNRSMQFYDYQHFNGNLTGVINFPPSSPFKAIDFSRARINNFQALNYYGFSTDQSFFKVHARHHFKGFILNKIPLVRKLRWYTLIGSNFLYTEPHGDYTEFYVGIENILKVLRVDVVASYQYGERIVPLLRIGTSVGF